ncbi:putative membrane protein [Pseudomonas syringae]|uniref:hypothetical protein n=1 Tax=Pseudomonas syringae TaxID=317 RepID=UPI001CA8E8F1|nr:hypothetical protein [Pseudomonas syringae]MCI3947131.1 putative membrane protein [Pseudomonas syringae]
MSIITKWALQAVALVVLGWMATVTASWNSSVASGTGNDRLAELNAGVLSSPVVSSARSTSVQGQ